MTMAIIGILAMGALPVVAISGAVFTTTNPAVDNNGTGTPILCLNGDSGHGGPNDVPAINCNIYTDKKYVWLTGGPGSSALADGTYFFAVLVPGGQPDPNDGGANNLADMTAAPEAAGSFNADSSAVPSGDAYTNRKFAISSGTISYSGTHDFADNEIRLMPYDDTTNPGGVYIMAVCSLTNGYPVDPSDCKYDAFKVKSAGLQPVGLTVIKDANPTFTRTYNWDIKKNVDKTLVEQIGGNATFNYVVDANETGFTDSAWQVAGTITVLNPNDDNVAGINVTDAINDVNTTCTVTGGSDMTIAGGSSQGFPYICAYSIVPASNSEKNTATVTWPTQTLPNGDLNGGSDSFVVPFSFDIPTTIVDDSVTVNDTFNGVTTTLGILTAVDSLPFTSETYKYSHTVNVPASNCVTYTNNAVIVETGQSSSQTVEVCGTTNTGALTMGFWQNKNGQGIIKPTNQTNLQAWLISYHPFSDAASSTNIAGYVSNIIKAATCTSTSKTCNSMLKAQMLATALDVYFSDPALGGNKINAPTQIGNTSIDLTKICKMIDGSGSTATCSGAYEDVSGAFNGTGSMTVQNILLYQNTADPAVDAGTYWYGQVKATQVLAKDTFDAINNQVVFSP